VTVVIPSGKKRAYTTSLNGWLKRYHVVVVHNRMGLARAFNECFCHAKSDTVVLLADDLLIDPAVCRYFNVEPGEFRMLDTGDFPINGVHVIRLKDFWRVGGFNEEFRFGNVDREFYARAVLAGLKYKPIPLSLVKHVKHQTRYSNIYKSFRVTHDSVTFIMRYFRYFPRDVLKHDFLNRIRRRQFRSLLLHTLYFFKLALFNRVLGLVAGLRLWVRMNLQSFVWNREHLTVGKNSFWHRGCFIDALGGVSIGSNVIIGPYTVIHSANHRFNRLDKPIMKQGHNLGKVVIGDDCWIGAHVTVLPGVHIGKGCVVGAGSVVTKSLPDYSVAVGNPAQIIKNRLEGKANGSKILC
jgi:acetyltransferase-like isoleucine patch superfamily enzyme